MAKIQTLIVTWLLLFGFSSYAVGSELVGFLLTNANNAKSQYTCTELNYMVRFKKLSNWWVDNKQPTIIVYTNTDWNHRMIAIQCFNLVPANFNQMLQSRGYQVFPVDGFPYGITYNYISFGSMAGPNRSRIAIIDK